MTSVTIIGVGLIGGSLGLSLRQTGFAKQVLGCGRSVANLEVAQSKGCIDGFTQDLSQAVQNADLVVVCVPVLSTASIFAQIAPSLKPNAVVTDVGSVKTTIVTAAKLLPAPDCFVGGHPIAGSEHSGAAAAESWLFKGKRWVLTPTSRTNPAALKLVSDMVSATGAFIDQQSPERHDQIFAWVSHVPHLLAFALAGAIAKSDANLFAQGGSALRDFLRVAASDPVMWRDIFKANTQAIRQAADAVQNEIQALLDQLQHAEQIERALLQAQQAVRKARGE